MVRSSLLGMALLSLACGGRSALDAGEAGAPPDQDPGEEPPDPGPSGRAGAGAGGAFGPHQTGGSAQRPPDAPQPNPEPEPEPDVNCTPHRAKGGQACTAPCVTTCGFQDMGQKTCDCVNGVFVSCHCPRPWNYNGHSTAPLCATRDGRTHWIDNTPCAQEWAQCIGSDPVPGTNPRGCVCLTDPVSRKLEWTCGSTNKWFLSE